MDKIECQRILYRIVIGCYIAVTDLINGYFLAVSIINRFHFFGCSVCRAEERVFTTALIEQTESADAIQQIVLDTGTGSSEVTVHNHFLVKSTVRISPRDTAVHLHHSALGSFLCCLNSCITAHGCNIAGQPNRYIVGYPEMPAPYNYTATVFGCDHCISTVGNGYFYMDTCLFDVAAIGQVYQVLMVCVVYYIPHHQVAAGSGILGLPKYFYFVDCFVCQDGTCGC